MYRNWNNAMYEQRGQTEDHEEEGYTDDVLMILNPETQTKHLKCLSLV
jgi:hypothetical protein